MNRFIHSLCISLMLFFFSLSVLAENNYRPFSFSLAEFNPYSLMSLPSMINTSHPGDLFNLVTRIADVDPRVAVILLNTYAVPDELSVESMGVVYWRRNPGLVPNAEYTQTNMDGSQVVTRAMPENAVLFRDYLDSIGIEGVNEYYQSLVESGSDEPATMGDIQRVGQSTINQAFTTELASVHDRVKNLNDGQEVSAPPSEEVSFLDLLVDQSVTEGVVAEAEVDVVEAEEQTSGIFQSCRQLMSRLLPFL